MTSNSKERGMIFNGPMVKAILSGQKTQTRRPVKFPHIDRDAMCELSGNELAGELSAGNYRNSPFGAIGDLIWVRETHHLDQYGYTYKADGDWIKGMRENGAFGCDEKWTPSMHMKRCASRILLEITNVRVERLNDISNEDAKSEGYPAELAADGGYYDPFLWFRNLWDGIYPEQSFKHNPWVWVIEFKRVQEQSND